MQLPPQPSLASGCASGKLLGLARVTAAAPFEAAVEAEEIAASAASEDASCRRHRLCAASRDLDEVGSWSVLTPAVAMKSRWEPEEGLGREMVPSRVRERAACCFENFRQDRRLPVALLG